MAVLEEALGPARPLTPRRGPERRSASSACRPTMPLPRWCARIAMAGKVVDASALGALLFGEPDGRGRGRASARGGPGSLRALLPFEVANVCLSKMRRHPDRRDALLGGVRHARPDGGRHRRRRPRRGAGARRTRCGLHPRLRRQLSLARTPGGIGAGARSTGNWRRPRQRFREGR